MSWIIFSLAAALAAIGVPLFALLGGLALFLFHQAHIAPAALIIELSRLADMPSLIAIPLFTFAGYLLAESKAPQRLLRLAEASLSWLPGGIAVASLGACALFTAFTGASGVTIIALGGVIYAVLSRQGYSEKFSLGLITTTGSLGLLFPPSLPIILYGLVAKISINKLFAATLIPGILLLLVLSIYAARTSIKSGAPRNSFKFSELKAALADSFWEVPLPFLIIGGIYGGIFTASEAAAVMAFYVLVVETLIYRDIKISEIPNVMVKSMALVGAILIVLGTALGLTNYLIDAEIPIRLFSWLQGHISGPWEFLLLLNLFLLIVNMVEIFSAIVIVVPIISPIALKYGIDPIHLGSLFLLNLEIGYMTPPMGLNLFLSSRRFEKPLPELYRAVLPFWLILIFFLALVTYIPSLSLWLPRILKMR
jgi:tripartite ATP-independent transporter DctM subunit